MTEIALYSFQDNRGIVERRSATAGSGQLPTEETSHDAPAVPTFVGPAKREAPSMVSSFPSTPLTGERSLPLERPGASLPAGVSSPDAVIARVRPPSA